MRFLAWMQKSLLTTHGATNPAAWNKSKVTSLALTASVRDKGAKDALADAVAAAEQGVEYTKTIIATKGRASYLGERSLGHQDPGATSFTTMLKVAAAHV